MKQLLVKTIYDYAIIQALLMAGFSLGRGHSSPVNESDLTLLLFAALMILLMQAVIDFSQALPSWFQKRRNPSTQ